MAVKGNDIKIILSLVDNISQQMSSITWNVTSNLSDITKQMQTSQNYFTRAWESMLDFYNESYVAFSDMQKIWWDMFNTLSWYIKDWVKDINSFEYSVERLATLTKNSTGATRDQVNALVKQAEALEKVWVATKDNIVAWMSQFATFDMTTDSIWKITEAFVDYVVAEKWANATTDEYISMANSLAQALNGNFKSLTASWFVLDDYTKDLISNGTESERVASIVEVLNSTYKDFNKTIANTAEWQWILLQRSLNDIRESIASALLPAIATLKEAITPIITRIAWFVQENPNLVWGIVWVATAISWLIAGIWYLWSALWPLSLWFKAIGSIITWAWPVLASIWTAIAWISRPIRVVIGAITALWVAYTTNFWWFRDFVNDTRERLQPTFESMTNAIINCFNTIFNTVSDVWNRLEPILTPIREDFKDILSTDILPIITEFIVIAFETMWQAVETFAKVFWGIVNLIKDICNGDWNKVWADILWIVISCMEWIVWLFEIFGIDLPWIIESIKTTLTNLRTNMFEWIKNIAKNALNRIEDKISSVWDSILSAKEAVSNFFWWWSTTPHASGWYVTAWQTYRVNEIHWEYFTPFKNWYISPAPAIAWNTSISINFNWDMRIWNESDENRLIQKMKDTLIETYENLSMWYK